MVPNFVSFSVALKFPRSPPASITSQVCEVRRGSVSNSTLASAFSPLSTIFTSQPSQRWWKQGTPFYSGTTAESASVSTVERRRSGTKPEPVRGVMFGAGFRSRADVNCLSGVWGQGRAHLSPSSPIQEEFCPGSGLAFSTCHSAGSRDKARNLSESSICVVMNSQRAFLLV